MNKNRNGERASSPGFKDTDEFRIVDFEKYVDENFDPILDSQGRTLFESQMLKDVSENARLIGRIVFQRRIDRAKALRKIPQG